MQLPIARASRCDSEFEGMMHQSESSAVTLRMRNYQPTYILIIISQTFCQLFCVSILVILQYVIIGPLLKSRKISPSTQRNVSVYLTVGTYHVMYQFLGIYRGTFLLLHFAAVAVSAFLRGQPRKMNGRAFGLV
jgi:hypothetical protein